MTTEADDLYSLPLDEFTAARNSLAARLKKEGDSEGWAAVKALKKPSITAWAINQVVRSQPGEVEALLGAGDELRRAQDELMSGSDPSALRDATKKRRDLVTLLTQRTAEALERGGTKPTRPHLDRITSTLLNASVDDDGRERLRSGTLAHEVEVPPDATSAWAASTPPDVDERSPREARAARKEAERLGREAEQAEALAAEKAQEAEIARRTAEVALQAASDARRAALAARRRADEARRWV